MDAGHLARPVPWACLGLSAPLDLEERRVTPAPRAASVLLARKVLSVLQVCPASPARPALWVTLATQVRRAIAARPVRPEIRVVTANPARPVSPAARARTARWADRVRLVLPVPAALKVPKAAW